MQQRLTINEQTDDRKNDEAEQKSHAEDENEERELAAIEQQYRLDFGRPVVLVDQQCNCICTLS